MKRLVIIILVLIAVSSYVTQEPTAVKEQKNNIIIDEYNINDYIGEEIECDKEVIYDF